MTTKEHLELAAMLHRGEYRRYLADPRPSETQKDRAQFAILTFDSLMDEHREDADKVATEQDRKSFALQLRSA